MAGSSNIGEETDNPVAINATAMVDVIFCLVLFFMCSFHFRELEGKIETWLPKEGGVITGTVEKKLLEDICIVIDWDERTNSASRRLGNRPPAKSDGELITLVLEMSADHEKLGKKDFPVVLDVARKVPWREVVHVMDLCKKEKLERIEFAAPAAKPLVGAR
ncbi:MAG TPA: biopolymer transporter ExbD [Planctomycetota bacterium]|jgi:biopolymer transport protein ExbD|nr:biopolymer transporter ExbD [Planctomycetota bacterium]